MCWCSLSLRMAPILVWTWFLSFFFFAILMNPSPRGDLSERGGEELGSEVSAVEEEVVEAVEELVGGVRRTAVTADKSSVNSFFWGDGVMTGVGAGVAGDGPDDAGVVFDGEGRRRSTRRHFEQRIALMVVHELLEHSVVGGARKLALVVQQVQ